MKARPDGEGSIYQRHTDTCPALVDGTRPAHRCTGPWVGALVIDSTEGKLVRRKVSAKTKAGVAVKLRELRETLAAAEEPTGRSVTVRQWMEYWYTRIAPRRVKPLTLAGYNAKVNQYIVPLLGHHRLDRLSPEHIEDAWDRLRDEGNPTLPDAEPLSANTIHQTHRILARALKVAVQRKKLRTNPAGADSMDAPPRVEQPVVPMTEDEVSAALAASRDTWNGARWSVALAIGLRQGEALGLRWEDVDLDDRDAGVLRVRQTLMRITGRGLVFGTPKSKRSSRDIPLPPSLVDRLRRHRTEQNTRRLELGNHWIDSGLVFTLEDGRPLDPSVDAGRWRKLLATAGVRHYRLHDARHSAGTFMLLDGVDVRVAMAILGHSQLSVTMRYQHAVDAALRDAATKMDARGRWA